MESVPTSSSGFYDRFNDNEKTLSLLVQNKNCDGVFDCIWEWIAVVYSSAWRTEVYRSPAVITACNFVAIYILMIQIPALLPLAASTISTIILKFFAVTRKVLAYFPLFRMRSPKDKNDEFEAIVISAQVMTEYLNDVNSGLKRLQEVLNDRLVDQHRVIDLTKRWVNVLKIKSKTRVKRTSDTQIHVRATNNATFCSPVMLPSNQNGSRRSRIPVLLNSPKPIPQRIIEKDC